ncbi:MAG: peptidoglycan editing factor PgeF [Methylococcaceae bacterium]|nr:peptidoglycan editing factor PgeF [Methylococcaceae bacterium]
MNWIKPDWPVASNIHAAVTLRSGGVSQNAFDSLNLGLHVNDEPENVYKNRRILSRVLDLPSEPVWMDQVHGIDVIKADQRNQIEKADASYTDKKNTVCAVLTADCLSILLATIDGKKIAAIHAGWRGLFSGVVANTVNTMGTINLVAWLGPAIGVDCFEVGQEVKNSFIKKSENFTQVFTKINEKKYLADIYKLAKIELASVGIKQVYGGGFCTVTDKERFYSYRRDGETGRMATLIWRD